MSFSEQGNGQGCLGSGAAAVNGQESWVEGSMDLKIQRWEACEMNRGKTGLKKCKKLPPKVFEGLNA